MTESTAYRYAKLFELMSEPKVLVMLAYMKDKGDYVALGELAKIAKLPETRTRTYTEEMEDIGIADQNDYDGVPHWKIMNSKMGNKVEAILKKLSY